MVDTAKVKERRALRFETFDAARADLAAIERAEASGRLRLTGNWTLGQITTHLAAFMNYPFDGFPPEMPGMPGPLRFVFRLMKGRFLGKGLPSGVRIPKVPEGTIGQEKVSSAEGLRRLRAAMDRLEKGTPTHPSPAFGPMTPDEWRRLNLRHCELHLSFAHPA